MSQHKLDHVKSNCCNDTIYFQTTSLGYSINVWCSKCKNYLFTGRLETLISFWFGDLQATIKNKGYLPNWFKDLDKNISKSIKELIRINNDYLHKDFVMK